MSTKQYFSIADIRDITAKNAISDNDKKILSESLKKDLEDGLTDAPEPVGADLYQLRNGYEKTVNVGNSDKVEKVYTAGQNVEIDEYLQERYGKSMNFSKFLKNAYNVDTQNMTFGQMINAFGGFNQVSLTSPQTVNDALGYRWLIPEVILQAVMRSWKKSGAYKNWIARTINSDQEEIILPQIKGENFLPTELGEGATIEMGVHEFVEKKAAVKQFGKGFSMTDRLMNRLKIDAMQAALASIGKQFAIKEEALALKALEADSFATTNTETAIIIGTETANVIAEIDIIRAIQALSNLGYEADTLIGVLSDTVSVQLLPLFRGYNGSQPQGNASLNGNSNVMTPQLATYSRRIPSSATKLALFDSNEALSRINYGAMKIEQDRTAKNLTSALYVSMFSGFVRENHQATVIIDKSVTYAANPFPATWLIESYVNSKG